MFDPAAVERFRYVGFELTRDADAGTAALVCRYALDHLTFEEQVAFEVSPGAPDVDEESVLAAARLVHLLAGVSYYKAAAPPTIEVGDGLTDAERDLLHAFYVDGLGEFAYRNDLDLTGVRIEAPERSPVDRAPADPGRSRPLVPFGGGIDSIVTVEGIRERTDAAALFIVSKAGDRFAAIEGAAAVTGLPIVRAERQLDPKILRSRELGYRNGHVPVTGVLSAIALTAALLDGRDAVVMSNEWSADSGNTVHHGRSVNHQWSKTLEFEDLFRAALAASVPSGVDYFSWLRPWSELWVAERLAARTEYHRTFRSCNRAFHIDPAHRLDHWCGVCDKCVFIDLILSPYLAAADLAEVFDGNEPLQNPELLGAFRTLCGLSGDIKPFECVGDEDECRVAALLAAGRPDRAEPGPVLAVLAAELGPLVPGDPGQHAARLHQPLGPHRVPDRYAPADLLG